MKIKSLFGYLKCLLKSSIKILLISYLLLFTIFVLFVLRRGGYIESDKLMTSIILTFIISCISPLFLIHVKIKYRDIMSRFSQLGSLVLGIAYYLIITRIDIVDLTFLGGLFIFIMLLFEIIVHHICVKIITQESFLRMLQGDVLLDDDVSILENKISKNNKEMKAVIKKKIFNSESIYELVENGDKVSLKLKDDKNIEFNRKQRGSLYKREFDGDEWNDMAEWDGVKYSDWKLSIVDTFIKPYIGNDKNILEIAVGHGRWTYYLLQSYNNYFGVDISRKCIDFCKEKFSSYDNCKFILGNGLDLNTIQSGTIDFVFSFDSFVHISQDVFMGYITEISRILSPNGICIIHHSGVENDNQLKARGLRAFCCTNSIYKHAKKNGLLVEKSLKEWGDNNQYSVKKFNDTISIFKKV